MGDRMGYLDLVIHNYGRGNETLVPSCATSRLFAELLEQKTLTRRDIERIARLGYEIRLNTKKDFFSK